MTRAAYTLPGPLTVREAWEAAWEGAHLMAHRDGDPNDVFVGSMVVHDGVLFVAAYDEFERVVARIRVRPDSYNRIAPFLRRNFIDTLVTWHKSEEGD